MGIYCNETAGLKKVEGSWRREVKNGEMTAATGESTSHASFSQPATLAAGEYEVSIDAEGTQSSPKKSCV